MSNLFLTIEPQGRETRLMLTKALVGTALRARLPPLPAQPGAIALLLEALSAWYGEPLCAVFDADAVGSQRHPETWAQLLEEVDRRHIRIEWVGHTESKRGRDRFLGALGDFSGAKRLVTFTATGQK